MKVKAEVRYSEGDGLTVSALDSATSLLQAAKNLLSSVILTVKCCYVASLASTTGQCRHHLTNHNQPPPLVWRIRRTREEHRDSNQNQQEEQVEEEEKEEEEAAQSLGTALRSSIRRGNYAYKYKPIFRAHF